MLTAPVRGQNCCFSAYLALKTVFYSFSGSKQALIKRLLEPSTWLGTLYKPSLVFLLFNGLLALGSPVSAQEARQVLGALRDAYPDKITALAFRDGDWSILVNGKVFYWAEGRMLDAENRDRPEAFAAYWFPRYPEEIPPVRRLSAEERRELNRFIERRESKADLRYPGFIQALWGMRTLHEAHHTVRTTSFLGHQFPIHPGILDHLAEIERELSAAAESNAALARWINDLSTVGGYVWRDIAGSANRSMHSYGIAVDFIPADYGGKHVYWRWSRDYLKEWWAIPISQRYRIPPAVVTAFEKRGFIWGAKWRLFDQMHFEYRPELIMLRDSQVHGRTVSGG